jgi:Kae1-associated kinase Bud32
MTIIARGAEAVLEKDGNLLIKTRVKKRYRIKELDEKLRKTRTRHENSLLREARRAGVAAPQVIEEDETVIKMEFIDGSRVKDILGTQNSSHICKKIGKSVAALHNNSIIHGDLTTSNMILRGEALYFIDFGLGFRSARAEDKANDLYLLHEALESTHFEVLEEAWKAVLDSYRESCHEAKKVLNTLSEIEKRGRYKNRTN